MAQNARQVPGQVQDGTVITVQASTPPTATKFSINLSSGPGDIGTSDLPLHADVRFNENAVVRNAYQNGSWGSEERAGGAVPIQKGQPFECIILVKNDQFMIAFNGNHYTEFRHRLPKERVTHVFVKGDAQVNNITFSGPGMSGGAAPYSGGYGQPGAFGQPQPAAYGQPQPGGYPQAAGYTQQPQAGGAQRKNIPGGLNPGRIIYINGSVNPGAQRFIVNLKNQEQGGDIYLHFNPRFTENAVAMNSLLGGSWGQEQRAQAPFPFAAGTPFSMMILTEPNQFKVAVNGNHFTEFPVRNPNLQAVQFVEVEGDVSGVQINTP